MTKLCKLDRSTAAFNYLGKELFFYFVIKKSLSADLTINLTLN